MASKNSRDVELVIRAKDAASKTIDDVADALKTLSGVQDKASKSAQNAGTVFDRLSGDLKKLDAEAKGLAALGKVAGEIDKASGAINRLQAAANKSAGDLEQLKQQQAQAAAEASRLATEYQKSVKALNEQKAATTNAKKAQSDANAEFRLAEQQVRRLETRINGLKAPTADLVDTLARQKAALEAVRAKQEQATATYNAQKTALENASKATAELKTQANAAAGNVGALETASSKVAASIERQNADLQKANTVFNELKGVAAGAQQALGGVALSADQITAASSKAAAGIAQITAALSKQNQGGGSAPLTGSKLVLTQLEAQRENVQRAQLAFENAQKEVAALAQQMKAAGGPTDELSSKFALAAASARKFKDDLIQQQQQLAKGSSFNAVFAQTIQQEQAAAAAARQSAQERIAAANQVKAANQASTAAAVAQARANLQASQGAAQLAQNFRALGVSSGGVATGMTKAASATGGLKSALSAIYGESRQALSLFQRIRGEVLALAASYVGLFAAIQSIGGVVNAYRTIEAAQNRLGAAFNQNTEQVGQEMRFLQVQANRLGIEFGVLSNEYAKFTIAASAANFEQENTRKIFLAVAEAARVQKLSLDDTQGVFLALQQMISKGKVSSEELRRQLGDRLPGAFNLFAEAMGVSTAELDKLMQKGEVFATQDVILKFADKLSEKFSSQLPEALKTLTTEIGRFENSLFNAQAQVARGGFADALREGLVKLNEFFNSQQGVQFFTSLGAALGRFINILTSGLQYIDQIIFLFKAFAAIKIAQTLQLAGTQLTAFAGKATAAGAQFTSFSALITAAQAKLTGFSAGLAAAGNVAVTTAAKVRTAGVATAAIGGFMAAARGAVLGLANGLSLLVRAAGGWVGIALTIASFALANYFTSTAGEVDKATAALEEHERIMQVIGTTYESTGGKIDDLGKKLKNVSLAQANQNFKDLNAAASQAFDAFKELDVSITARSRGTSGEDPQVAAIKRLVAQAQTGQITITAFRDRLNELSKALTSDAAIEYAGKADKLAADFENLIKKTIEQGKVTADLGNTSKEAALAAELFAKQLAAQAEATDKNKTATDAAAEAAAAYNTAMAALIQTFPKLKQEAETFGKIIEGITAAFNAFKAALGTKEITALVTAFATLGTGGPLAFMTALAEVGKGDFSKLGQVFSTLGAGLASLNPNAGTPFDLSKATGSVDAAMQLIKKFEGRFIDTGVFQDNAPRAGFSSDTTTGADGIARRVTIGMKVTLEDANRDLARRITESFTRLQQTLGADVFDKLSDPQKAVLASLEYNFGQLPKSVENAIKAGKSDEEVAQAIRDLGKSSKYADLTGRRNQEADIFAADKQLNADKQLESQKQIADEAEREAKAKADAQAQVQKSIEQGNFEVAQLQETARQAAINKAVREQELVLQAQGLTLSQQQREQIAANAAAQFDAANKEKEASKERELIEQRVNQLYELRKQLQENITFAQEQGQVDKAEQLKQQLTDTDAKLKEAIADATAFYQKMGGPEADLAIQKLDGMNNSLVETKQRLLDARAVNDLLVNGLSNAFSEIAQNIATVIQQGGSLKDVLKGIGQAFLKFAADFLLQLGQMIVKQALFNALAGGQSGTGGVGGFLAGIFHGGGVVGRGGTGGQRRRKLPASVFANAPRFHGGGMPGLGRNEVAAVLKRNEEVLSENDPRNALNGGLALAASGGGGANVKIVNTFDAASYLDEALNSRVGEKAILNAVRANSRQFKQALEG